MLPLEKIPLSKKELLQHRFYFHKAQALTQFLENYSKPLRPDDVAKLKSLIARFINQALMHSLWPTRAAIQAAKGGMVSLLLRFGVMASSVRTRGESMDITGICLELMEPHMSNRGFIHELQSESAFPREV